MTDVYDAVKAAGGVVKVARRMGVSPQRASNWSRKGAVPDDQVLAWCRAVEWRRTPHQIAPHLYPHPLDGLPADLRKSA